MVDSHLWTSLQAEGRGLRVQGDPELHSGALASLMYTARPCLNNNINKTNKQKPYHLQKLENQDHKTKQS